MSLSFQLHLFEDGTKLKKKPLTINVEILCFTKNVKNNWQVKAITHFLLVSYQDFAASVIDVTKTVSIESTRTKMTMLSTAIHTIFKLSFL